MSLKFEDQIYAPSHLQKESVFDVVRRYLGYLIYTKDVVDSGGNTILKATIVVTSVKLPTRKVRHKFQT